MNYVVSTMSASVTYDLSHVSMDDSLKDQNVPEKVDLRANANKILENKEFKVTITGKHLIAGDKSLVTGVGDEAVEGPVTAVTDEQLEALRKHPVFIQHHRNGFLRIIEQKSKNLDKHEMRAIGAKEAKSMPLDNSHVATEADLDKIREENRKKLGIKTAQV